MQDLKEIIDDLLKRDKSFRYQMLCRLASDCEYYLGCGRRYAGSLWSHDESRQIELMIALHNSFGADEKPQWLSMEQIMEYKKEMISNPNNQ